MSVAEQEMVERMPAFIDKCLANIPRIEPVREVLRLYPRAFGDRGNGPGSSLNSEIPWGARALKIGLDLDSLESGENRATAPFAVLRGRSGSYDSVILEAFAKLRGDSQDVRPVELQNRELAIGMVFWRRSEVSERHTARRAVGRKSPLWVTRTFRAISPRTLPTVS